MAAGGLDVAAYRAAGVSVAAARRDLRTLADDCLDRAGAADVPPDLVPPPSALVPPWGPEEAAAHLADGRRVLDDMEKAASVRALEASAGIATLLACQAGGILEEVGQRALVDLRVLAWGLRRLAGPRG